MKIFICYSRKDKVWKDRLLKHLAPMQKLGELDVWEDSQITIGDEWFSAIEKAINEADAAILLISSDSLSSEFIQKEEVQKMLKRREQEKMLICPLLIKSCLWTRVEWLRNIQMWPRNGEPLNGYNSDYEIDKSLVEFIDAVYAAFDKKDICFAADSAKKSESVQIENDLDKPNVSIRSNKKRKQKEDNQPDKLDKKSQRNRLLLMVFFGMFGGALFAVVFGAMLKEGLSYKEININLKPIVLFNSLIWAAIGAFCAKDEEYNIFAIVGSFVGFFAWLALDGVFNGVESNFIVRAFLFGPGAGGILGVHVKWILKKKIWLPVIKGLLFLLLSAIIYFTFIYKANDINSASVWIGDWLHRETWSNKPRSIHEGTMTLKMKKSNSGGSHAIEGNSYNISNQESIIIGTLKNDGKTLIGEWKNKEAGKTGTFEWHYIPPASFRGYYTIRGDNSKYSWCGDKFTSDFGYEISKDIMPDTDFINLRTIFLSEHTLSKMKEDTGFEQMVDKSTIIAPLKVGTELHVLDTVECKVNKVGKWYKILTRIDKVLRIGYISSRRKKISTITELTNAGKVDHDSREVLTIGQ